VTLPYLHVKCETDGSHPRFVADHNRCILCTRCLRVCDQIEGAHTWDMTGRGIGARMITDMGEPWGNSATCTNCGKCVMVCPVGALVAKGKSVAEMTKPEFLPYLLQMRGEER
jgi:bidirectional [NiFe] hydrogenase diaphorase subunit